MQHHATTLENDSGPVPIRLTFMRKVFFLFAVLAALSALISVAGKWVGREISMAGHTDSEKIQEVVIGNDVLAVPANMIRFENSRRDGVANRLDLYLRWPDMEGYSQETKDDFNHVDGSKRILFVSFEQRMMSRDMSGRFEPIYRSLIESSGKSGPGGLTVYPFTAQSGYVDEVLIVGDEATPSPFVARCLAGEQARQSLAPCERDIHVGEGLNLVYRLPAQLAGSWKEVDAAVRKFAGDIIQD